MPLFSFLVLRVTGESSSSSTAHSAVLQERFSGLLSVQGGAPVGRPMGALVPDEVREWSFSPEKLLGLLAHASEHNTEPLGRMKVGSLASLRHFRLGP